VSAHVVPPDLLARHLTQLRALFDGETGLPGPALLLDRIDMALARARSLHFQVGALCLHNVQALGGAPLAMSAIAGRLRNDLRVDDTLARLCDRTFVVVCNDVERDEDATPIAQRLVLRAGVACRLGIALGLPSDHPLEVIARAVNAAGAEFSDVWPPPRGNQGH
jgi:GGDEF domain-containing protein